MNTKYLPSLFLLLAFKNATFAQGALTPPGPPAATMQTLDQLGTKTDQANATLSQINSKADTIDAKAEKRIPIDATHTPGDANVEFIIAQTGSYYLIGNVNVGKLTGIQITAAGVTLDLNGFAIARTSGSGGVGILATGTATNCTIKNGSVLGFSTGVFGGGRGSIVSHVIVSGCSQAGMAVVEGSGIDHCNVHDNVGSFATGISASSGSTVSHCNAAFNTGSGISAGDGVTIVDCSAVNNQGTAGISTGSGCTITACTAHANTNTNATPSTTSGAGIIAGSRTLIQNCSVSSNKSDGINASDNCTIILNSAALNGNGSDGAGIHVSGSNSRIEANNVTSNDRGIDIDFVGNLIVRITRGVIPRITTSRAATLLERL